MNVKDTVKAIENRTLILCQHGTYIADGLLSRYNRHTGWHYSLRLLDIRTNGNSILYADVKDCEIIK